MNEFKAFSKANDLLILERQITNTIHNTFEDIQRLCSDCSEEEINRYIVKLYNTLDFMIQREQLSFEKNNKTY